MVLNYVICCIVAKKEWQGSKKESNLKVFKKIVRSKLRLRPKEAFFCLSSKKLPKQRDNSWEVN